MRLKGATTILKKDCEFLGITFDELITFIERSPLAMKNSTIEAHKVWKRETNRCYKVTGV
jgi:hypothetical protein